VRTVLAGLVAGCVIIVADLVTPSPDSLIAADTIGTFIGRINGQDAIFAVDDDKRFLMTVDQ